MQNLIPQKIKLLDLNLEDFNIIDIRPAQYYATAHYKGAKNIDNLTEIFQLAKTSDKPLLLTCFSGNTARILLERFCHIVNADNALRASIKAPIYYLSGDIGKASAMGLLED